MADMEVENPVNEEEVKDKKTKGKGGEDHGGAFLWLLLFEPSIPSRSCSPSRWKFFIIFLSRRSILLYARASGARTRSIQGCDPLRH